MTLEIIGAVIILLSLIHLWMLYQFKQNLGSKEHESVLLKVIQIENTLLQIQKSIKDEFHHSRMEMQQSHQLLRGEWSAAHQAMVQKMDHQGDRNQDFMQFQFGEFQKRQAELVNITLAQLQEIRGSLDHQLSAIRHDNHTQLTEMRTTVDEKLQKTLNERLAHSFETVGKQLQAVQEGLGEMRNLASDVGGLKRVLTNVKMRGGIGEVQLAILLEQILAPEQYASEVSTKAHSREKVEFAVKLPGRDQENQIVWLPIDAKFPKDVYETLQDAYEDGDATKIMQAQKTLENTIRKMAKDIRDKYLDPPHTTNFGIMFLPFEGIYAEVVRKAAFLEELQREYQIIITGPTTLAAILNSLQMGFRTLAIQKRSSEVWKVLGEVSREFENFGGLMEKAQKNIQQGLTQLEDVMGKRTRAIQRKLKAVDGRDHQSPSFELLEKNTDADQ